MAMKKKGTPEKIKIVIESTDLEKFKKLVEKATTSDAGLKIVKESKQKKGK